MGTLRTREAEGLGQGQPGEAAGLAPGPVLFPLDPPPASSGHSLLLISVAGASTEPGQSLLTAWCGGTVGPWLSGVMACVQLCIVCAGAHILVRVHERVLTCAHGQGEASQLSGWVGVLPPQGHMGNASRPRRSGLWREWRGLGTGKDGAGPQQLTSWASGGRCPEASRGSIRPWGTCPPTAPGGPEEEGHARSPREDTSALLPLPTLVLSRPIFSISILGCRNSYDVINSQSQLLKETPRYPPELTWVHSRQRCAAGITMKGCGGEPPPGFGNAANSMSARLTDPGWDPPTHPKYQRPSRASPARFPACQG